MSKYGNTHCTASDGRGFASMKERRRYEALLLLQRLGEISDLKTQVAYELIPKQVGERSCSYVADFTYTDAAGGFHCEDTKGFRTKEYIVKRKLMQFLKGIRIEEL